MYNKKHGLALMPDHDNIHCGIQIPVMNFQKMRTLSFSFVC